jgi:hypothetical protein
MKKKLLLSSRWLVSLCLFIFFITVSTTVKATTRYVNPNGLCDGNSPCYSTIQAAINASSAGDVIIIASGTYHENVNINKWLTLNGAGTTTIIQPSASGPGISINSTGTSSSQRAIVSNLKVTGAIGSGNTGSGISILATTGFITVDNVTSTANGGNGITTNNSLSMMDIILSNVNCTNNVSGVGFRVATSTIGIDGLQISNSHFDNNLEGLNISSSNVAPSPTRLVTNVQITNSTFNNNTNKGIYVERLNNATIQDITVQGSAGVSAPSPVGIDVNLKYNAFSNINFINVRSINSAPNGTGIYIKARNDASYSGNPASLNGVTITGGEVTGSRYGIFFENKILDATVHGLSIHDNTVAGMVNQADNSLLANATCNWWGSLTGPTNPFNPGGTGNAAVGNISYSPWLTVAGDINSCNGTFTSSSNVVVNECNGNGWVKQTTDGDNPPGTASIGFQSGPGAPPLGSGSAKFSVGSNGWSEALLRTSSYSGALLSSISELKYSTYVQHDGSGGQAVYLLLYVDYNNDAAWDDILFFEPVYQTAAFFPANPQAPLALNTWQEWDAKNGGWWSLNGTAGAGPGTNVKPLSAIIAAHPNAAIASGNAITLEAGFGAGSWDNFVGNADAFKIAGNGNSVTYDFENPPNTYYYDNDGDGFGDPNNSVQACSPPPNYVSDHSDCNDNLIMYQDNDHDGFGSNTKVPCDGVTNHDDCDDNVVMYQDNDHDGYGSNTKVACGGVTNNYDANDNDGKADIYVCHKGKSIVVNDNSLKAHLNHGDQPGQCPTSQSITQAAPLEMTEALLGVSKLQVYPNPSFGQFTLQLNNLKAAKAQILLMDQNGRTIEQRSIQLINGQQNVIYNTRKFASGMYMVKVVSEDGVQTSKVVIQH